MNACLSMHGVCLLHSAWPALCRRLFCARMPPTVQGGGLCDVENLRTLCVLCHLEVTKRQTKERAAERAALRVG